MSKKVVIAVVGIVIFILLIIFLIGYFNFQSEREIYYNDFEFINEGLKLIGEEKYDEGMAKCNEFKQSSHSICHAATVQLKKAKNKTITKEFCDSIPTKFESNRAFTLDFFRFFEAPNEAEIFERDAQKLAEECYQASSST